MSNARSLFADARYRVLALESEMLKRAQVNLRVNHIFAPGIYMRELHIPAGVLSTGKIHKYEHIGILLRGTRDMFIDGKLEFVTAPFTTTIKAGSKLACYTWEDSVYVTVHPNPDDDRDIEKLERRYVCDTEMEYLEFRAAQRIRADELKVIEQCPS